MNIKNLFIIACAMMFTLSLSAHNRKHSIRAILAYLCPKTKEDAAVADAAEARMNAVLGKIGK